MRSETPSGKVLALAEWRQGGNGEEEERSLKWVLGFIHKPHPDNH